MHDYNCVMEAEVHSSYHKWADKWTEVSSFLVIDLDNDIIDFFAET